MKTILALVVVLVSPALFGQTAPARGERKQQVILAAPQPAQTVTEKLSPEAATALESLRLSTPGPRAENGVSAPQFATIQELWNAITKQMVIAIVQRFPPQAVKASQDAAAKAKAEADAAAASTVK